MKYTTILICLSLFLISSTTFGQAKNQLSFGIVGAAWEIPVADDVTVGPAAYTDLNLDYLVIGAKGNYYFDNSTGLSKAFWNATIRYELTSGTVS